MVVETVEEEKTGVSGGVADVKLWARETTVGFPGSLQQAASLLNQQIWCWGRDIKASRGNLLVRHGFQRIENPSGARTSSVYRLELPPTSRVILRGFGVFVGDDRYGGIFLPRFEFTPQLSLEADLFRPAWSSRDLPPLTFPRTDQMSRCQMLLLTLSDWIRRYEVWVAEQAGIAYRKDSLLAWKTNEESVVPAEETARAWRMLGLVVSMQPERFIRCLESRSVHHA